MGEIVGNDETEPPPEAVPPPPLLSPLLLGALDAELLVLEIVGDIDVPVPPLLLGALDAELLENVGGIDVPEDCEGATVPASILLQVGDKLLEYEGSIQ